MLLAFEQAPYEGCGLNRINILITFSGSCLQKVQFSYDICTPDPQKLQDIEY
jgi:hypothetical protein